MLHPDAKLVGTFNNFVGRSNGPKIDYIFTDSNTHVLSATIIRKQNGDGIFPSDHFPVTANLYFGLECRTNLESK